MSARIAAIVVALAVASAPMLAFADGTLSTNSDCGGDAFSSAQVIEHRPPRRGPISTVPQTLCADLAPQRPATNVDIQAYPLIAPENGHDRFDAPYGRHRR